MKNNNNNNSNGNGSHSWWASLWRRSHGSDQQLAPYRRIAIQLHYDLPRPDSARSVLLVSPTTSACCALGGLSLASCLAEEIRRPILLIDACPRGPEVSGMLECATMKGFADLLSDPSLPLEELVLSTNHQNVKFLPAGTTTLQPAAPEAVKTLLKTAEERYDFVLLSGGSVLNDSMALALAPCVGCVLLLAVENETMVEDLDAAQDALSFCRARKVGLVFATPARR
jgi:Mrp family chromosome partitioning ATPase